MGAHGINNKQQAMCSTHRDIWWPAQAHQQDRDLNTPHPHLPSLWAPRLEQALWAPGLERALERTLWAHGTERTLERTLWAHGTERALERTIWAHGTGSGVESVGSWIRAGSGADSVGSRIGEGSGGDSVGSRTGAGSGTASRNSTNSPYVRCSSPVILHQLRGSSRALLKRSLRAASLYPKHSAALLNLRANFLTSVPC